MTRLARRIRIGIDAGMLAFPAGGVRRYVQELLAALPSAANALSSDVAIVAIGTPPGADLPVHVQDGPGVVAVPTNLARAALSLPWAIQRAALDLFHSPAYTAPLVGRTPVVLTIHDVSYARRPEFYAYRSGRIRQWFYRRSAQAATHIITDSEFSRREIVAAYGIPESRITVVPLGVGAPFAPARQDGVCTPYVLHVGDLHPRRNVEAAARAVIGIRRQRRVPDPASLQLVCAGRDSGSAASLRATFDAAGMPTALHLTGPVSETELVALYQGAAAFVYPSLYEGFGLPALEAMACGTPVVALRAGSVPEVLGDAGLLIDEGDDRGFVEALTAVLTNPERATALRAVGLARAATFTWARTARETLDVYLGCLRDGTA